MKMKHDHSEMQMENHQEDSHLMFPFRFYRDGQYILWVQVKIDGKVFSQKYDIDVGN
jgi:hypothetical protein